MLTSNVNYPTRAHATPLFPPTKMLGVATKTALKLSQQLVSPVLTGRLDALEDQLWEGEERIMRVPTTMIKGLVGDMMQ